MMSFISRSLYILPAGGRPERIILCKRRIGRGHGQTKGLTQVQAFFPLHSGIGSGNVIEKLERAMGFEPNALQHSCRFRGD
jgi:hypothetical protein